MIRLNDYAAVSRYASVTACRSSALRLNSEDNKSEPRQNAINRCDVVKRASSFPPLVCLSVFLTDKFLRFSRGEERRDQGGKFARSTQRSLVLSLLPLPAGRKKNDDIQKSRILEHASATTIAWQPCRALSPINKRPAF